MVVLIAIIAVLGYYMPCRVTHHTVYLHNLPRELDGLTVAHLSDLHCSMLVRRQLISSAVSSVDHAKPDIIVLTGDYVSRNARRSAELAEMLSHLKPGMGIYAVLGNHDYWTDGQYIRNQLEQNGVNVLVNENTCVVAGLFILGLDDVVAGRPDVTKTWNGIDPRAAQILLSHNPCALHNAVDKDCLILSGHSHGIRYRPGLYRSLIPTVRIPEYTRGWYQEGKARMYVNRGIGMGFGTLLFRPFIPPEVSIFKLRSDRK